MEAAGAERYRAAQVFRWLYRAGVRSFDEMTDVPDALRRKLKDRFHITHPVLLDSRRSPTDGTTKYLLRLEDGETIETVFLPEKARATVCLSSQVGCRFSCSFCASAPSGFVRNLKASEMLDEVLFIGAKNPSARVTNIVFMGIGEPFDNYANVMKAIRVFNDRDAFNIGARRITVSTCGIIPAIKKFALEGLQLELSVSLHSADDAVRSKIVPVNRRYPLKDLIAACGEYTAKTGRVITFEYILIKGVNCLREDAARLAALLKGLKCKVNTISYNEIKAKNFDVPSAAEAREFVKALRSLGINAVHRKSRGEDIDAGCGQLRSGHFS
jgi:23S rRNA (adenine2503-C2)-methyltransferase